MFALAFHKIAVLLEKKESSQGIWSYNFYDNNKSDKSAVCSFFSSFLMAGAGCADIMLRRKILQKTTQKRTRRKKQNTAKLLLCLKSSRQVASIRHQLDPLLPADFKVEAQTGSADNWRTGARTISAICFLRCPRKRQTEIRLTENRGPDSSLNLEDLCAQTTAVWREKDRSIFSSLQTIHKCVAVS